MKYFEKDPYDILGVTPGASLDEIKKAYRRLVRKWHPDICGKNMANIKRFLAIKDAYILLKEKVKRKGPSKNLNLSKSFFSNKESLKKSNFPEGAFSFVQIPIEKALKGTKITIEVNEGDNFCPSCQGLGSIPQKNQGLCRKCLGKGYRILPWGNKELKIICKYCSGKGYEKLLTCPKCKGKGFISLIRKVKVTIPPGTKDGTILKFPGEGPFDPEKKSRTTLFLEIEVQNPKGWIIHGKDIISTIDIDCWTHIGGGYIQVNTIDGPQKIFLTPGIKRERFLRIKGHGWIDENGRRGDMLLRINILTPKGPCPKKALELIELLKRLWPCEDISKRALPGPDTLKDS